MGQLGKFCCEICRSHLDNVMYLLLRILVVPLAPSDPECCYLALLEIGMNASMFCTGFCLLGCARASVGQGTYKIGSVISPGKKQTRNAPGMLSSTFRRPLFPLADFWRKRVRSVSSEIPRLRSWRLLETATWKASSLDENCSGSNVVRSTWLEAETDGSVDPYVPGLQAS
jgi:hypothetical protein